MTNWNSYLVWRLNDLVNSYEWLEGLVIFATKPFLITPLASLDSLLLGGLFLVIFIYYDGEPGFLKVSNTTIRKMVIITLTGLIAWSLSIFLKGVFLIPRPYEAMEAIRPVFTLGTLDSFPSGHATFFSALAVAVFYYHKKLGIVFLGGVMVILISRIGAGVHYPLDILAGVVLGAGGAWLARIMLGWLIKKGYLSDRHG